MKRKLVIFLITFLLIQSVFAQTLGTNEADTDGELEYEIECESDSDCDEDEVCEEGFCIRLSCDTSDDCPEDMMCYNSECREIECESDSDCDEDEVCEDGLCVNQEILEEANQTGVDEEIIEETGIMHTPYGAIVRLLQLEKSVLNQKLNAEEVVNEIESTNPNVSTENLTVIISEMELLLEEIQNTNTTGQSITTLTQDYVDMRQEAGELVREFRIEASQYLNESHRRSMRVRFAGVNRSEVAEITNEIIEYKREFNAERVSIFLEEMGAQNQTLLEMIKNGEIPLGVVKSRISQRVRSMSVAMRRNTLGRVKQVLAQNKNVRNAVVINALRNFNTIRTRRVQERLQKINQTSGNDVREKVLNKINKRIEDLQQKREEIMNRTMPPRGVRR